MAELLIGYGRVSTEEQDLSADYAPTVEAANQHPDMPRVVRGDVCLRRAHPAHQAANPCDGETDENTGERSGKADLQSRRPRCRHVGVQTDDQAHEEADEAARDSGTSHDPIDSARRRGSHSDLSLHRLTGLDQS